MASRTATPLPSELGAFARKALRDLEPEGFRFVGLTGGVVIVEHPEYGRLEMTNDSYSTTAVGPRRGLYADAVINDVCQVDDGEFELHLASVVGAPVETVPLYDRFVSAMLEGEEIDDEAPPVVGSIEAADGDEEPASDEDADE